MPRFVRTGGLKFPVACLPTESRIEAEVEAVSDSESGTVTESVAVAVAVADSESEAESESVTESESEAESETVAATVAVAATEAESETVTVTEAESETVTVTDSETESDAVTGAESDLRRNSTQRNSRPPVPPVWSVSETGTGQSSRTTPSRSSSPTRLRHGSASQVIPAGMSSRTSQSSVSRGPLSAPWHAASIRRHGGNPCDGTPLDFLNFR